MLPFPARRRNGRALASCKLAFILVSGLSLAGCSKKLAPAGHFQNTPVIADGMPDDWSLPLRFGNANYTFRYNVTNDRKNIYICILSRDETTMIRMLRAGMTVYLAPKGDKARDISLHYPLRKQPDPATNRNRNSEPLTNATNNGWKEELLTQSDYYGTTGFAGIENGQFALTDSTKSPIRVAMKLNNQDSMLVYEAIIPIRIILNNDLGSRSLKKPFTVGITLNTPAVTGNGATPPRSFGGGGKGLGIGIRGMGGSGGGRRHTPANNQPAKEEINWYQFRLVSQ